MEDRSRGPEKIGDILSRVLRNSGLLEGERREELVEAWRTVAGPHVSSHTSVASFRSGVLTVSVDSAPLRQELELYQKEGLLRHLQEIFRKAFVREIRFRLV